MRITPQIICDIIKDGMALKDDQIWVYNQRRSIPEDKRLYITVGVMTMKPYGNNKTFNATTLNDELSQYITDSSARDNFCRALINQLVNFSFEGIFQQRFACPHGRRAGPVKRRGF